MKRVKASELPPPDPSILQEMLAARRAPGLKGSERAFLQGRIGASHDLDTMPLNSRTKWLMMAKKAGISLEGKVHMSGIGQGLDSWVSNFDEGLSRLKARGDRVVIQNGEVVYEPPEQPEKPDIPLAEDIVRDSVRDMVKVNPGLKKKKYRELREMAIEKHGPRKQ
jgi:hypothetical protein